jgi:hypothetical protein
VSSLRTSAASARSGAADIPGNAGVSMNARTVRRFIGAVALVLAVSALALAQTPTVKVGFNFLVADKTLEAGTYSVGVAANGNVVFTPEKGGTAVEVPQLKVLSTRKVDRVELAFDLVGSARYLTEVWVPGKGGFQVAKVPYSEDRETVTGPKVK